MMYKRQWWRVGVFAVALVAFALAAPTSAQEQTGSIVGTVTDASLGVLPGVSVEALGSAAKLDTTTDSVGLYRFPRVPPGMYVVTAKLEGFNPGKVTNVAISLGQTRTINFSLEVGGVAEAISVEAAQIDIQGSQTATSFGGETLERIPKGRDFTDIAASAAGASNEGFLGGLSIDGASGSENRFIIDGIDTTHPQDGVSGQNMVVDFIEEVQVKSAGYAAEYGGSVGGVVNAVTKSGSNEFKGWVGLYYGDRSWDGDERPTPYETDPSLYRTFREEDITRVEPGFGIGGLILRDKLWFFAGYSYSETETTRHPVGQADAVQTNKQEYFLGNLKGNFGSQFLYKLSYNNSPRKLDNTLPARDGSTPAGTNFNIDNEYDAESYSGYFDFIPTDNFYTSARAGYYKTDTQTSGITATERIFFRNGDLATLGYMPASDPRYRPIGFATVPAASFTGAEFDLWEREAAALDGTLFVNVLGSHAFKAGVQYEKIYNDVINAEAGNLFEIRWGLPDRFGNGTIGTYGSVHVRRFGTFGAVESKNLGFFLQDSWAPIPQLTLNLGLRTEKEEVPNYGHNQDPTLPTNAWEFNYGDKLAPRLGFAWNVLSNQKLKVYGSWGIYYDISKLEMARGSFGGDRWIAYLYPLETLDWQTLPNGCTTSVNDPAVNPCPALGTPNTLDLRHPTDPRDPVSGIEPDLQPFEQEEIQFGAEYQVTQNSVVGVRYVNKQVQAAIEDIGFLACETPSTCFESYFVGNPGLGNTSVDPDGVIPASPLAKREYEAIELTFHRRFVNNFSASLGYTYSSLEGNYSGLASSDEFGRTDPNVSRMFDAVHNTYDQNGRAVYGPLNTDRPHQIDAQVLYRFGFGTSIGLNQYYGSGTPISTQINYAGVPFFAFGRKDAGRTDDLTKTDLLISHPFTIGPVTIEASLNVLNLFDEDTALLIDPYSSNGDVCDFDANCDGSAQYFFDQVPFDANSRLDPADANPFYLKPNVKGSTIDPFQTRRTIRAGLRIMF